MVLDEILKCFHGLTASQRKIISKEIIGTSHFLAALISGVISCEHSRLKTFMGFDIELHKILMVIISSHASVTVTSKKKIEEIEERAYQWLTSNEPVTVDEVYSVIAGA